MTASSLAAWIAGRPRSTIHRPWPRVMVDAAGWADLRQALAEHAAWCLLSLWADAGDGAIDRPPSVHVALRDEADGTIAVVSLATSNGSFPSLASVRPGAVRLERAIRSMHGLVPDGLTDQRPWLDHGRFAIATPLAAHSSPHAPRADGAEEYRFLAVEGEGLHQIPVGPVHAGIIEPGHFRFHANGETVARLEQKLGYVHKGTLRLMIGKTPADAARLAARISGDSTVAHSLGFARAVEAALGMSAPPRAQWLRGVMAELERLANHFGDIGAICNDASFAFLHAQTGRLRELTLRAAQAAFGHRLMMDRVIPGGVARDLDDAGAAAIKALVAHARRHFPRLVAVYENKASLLDRTLTTGVTRRDLVDRFGAGGHVARAAGRAVDARRSPGYPPYDRIAFDIPVRTQGDVYARVWIRIREVEASLGLLDQMLLQLPAGPIVADLPAAGEVAEGLALVEAFRGELLTAVVLDTDGRVRLCHVRDASWFQWPLLEAAIEGNIVADFPLCNKSFNCSYSGHDL